MIKEEKLLMKQAKQDWLIARKQAEQCANNELIDYHAYNVLAKLKLYEYFITKSKKSEDY